MRPAFHHVHNARTGNCVIAVLLLTKPNDERIQRFIDDQSTQTFSYKDVGATRGKLPKLPAGFVIDSNMTVLGSGSAGFERAKNAVRSWKMFDIPWIALHDGETPIEAGKTVAVMANLFGVYSINACRIVYTIDERDKAGSRFGFAYGTLPDHMEAGEERFQVKWDAASDLVFFEILAFSRPAHLVAKIAKPLARRYQRLFAEQSMEAMTRATATT